MIPSRLRVGVVLMFLLVGAGADLYGEVTRIEIISRTDVLGNRSFGSSGPYELILARVYYAVDPDNPQNQLVVDLDKAPRNARGLVEFSSDLYILAPKDPRRGNGALLYSVVNRGRRSMPGKPRVVNVPEVGDDFLMRHGFTVVWSGWQFDLPEEARGQIMVRLKAPVATENGKPIEGIARSDFVLYEKEYDQSLGHFHMLPYPAIAPNHPVNQLSVRPSQMAERTIIPRSEWGFGQIIAGEIVPGPNHVYLKNGFESGLVYEVVWRSHNTGVAGLGNAAVRDLISHFKYDPNAVLSVERAYAFGTSQSGRMLKGFIYEGFNADEHSRKVFDGIIPNVAANGNQGMNYRMSQPSRGNFPALYGFFTPTNLFPFTDYPQTDPETGKTDGILMKYDNNPEAMPKIFYPNAGNEYWGRVSALTHVTIDGEADMPIPDNVRIYAIAGTAHGPASFPPERTNGVHRNNTNDFIWLHRALFIAMDRWVRDGIEPPASQVPLIADGSLVPVDQVNWPDIPGAELPQSVPAGRRVYFGPRWEAERIVDIEPPEVGSLYPVLQTQVDEDGNDIAGVRLPDVAVPLATLTGWNLRGEQTGGTTEIAGLLGSYVPFPRTRAERERSGDPRLSIDQRYSSRAEYLGLYAQAALKLIDEGYLLAEDLPHILKQGAERWDWAMGAPRN